MYKIYFGKEVGELLKNVPAPLRSYAEVYDRGHTEFIPFVFTEGNQMIQAFEYVINGQKFLIPEPDPTLIYFDAGRQSFQEIGPAKFILFEELQKQNANTDYTLRNMYAFYMEACSCLIFLFNAMEAFINNTIPVGYTFTSPVNQEILNDFKIQREVNFEDKVKVVLPDISKKAFDRDHGHK